MNVDIRADHVTYKCFDCLKLRNPLKHKPIIITAIVGFPADQQGHISIQMANNHVCPRCYRWGNFIGKYAPLTEVDPKLSEHLKQNQLKPPILDRSGQMPGR